MRYIFSLYALFSFITINAQVIDNFNDSNLLANPAWQGTNNAFTTINGELRSNYATINNSFYISTNSNFVKNCIWQIDIRLLFNTSSANYVDVALSADSANLLNMKNGYFVRLGGTLDEVCLYKIKSGIETKIIDGTDGILNTSNNQCRIMVTKLVNNTFILQRQNNANSTTFIEGIVKDSDIVASNYFGIRIRQSTATFINKHFFDNLSIAKIFKDTIAPLVDSCVLKNSNTITILFNEPCDTNTLKDTNNYNIIEGGIKPIFCNFAQNRKSVILNFKNAFESNKYLNIKIKGIKDTLDNTIKDTIFTFYYSKSDTARYRELLITELLPDPDPMVGLPNTEYVEIKNISGKYINLNGCKIHDPSGFKALPNIILKPDSFLVLYNIPSLNNGGDEIWLTNQMNQIIHKMNYNTDWYKDNIKKNGGWSLEMKDVSYTCNSALNWAASINAKGGTPGKTNSINGTIIDSKAPVFINYIVLNDSFLQFNFDEELDSAIVSSATFSLNGISTVFNLKQVKGNETFWKINFTPNADSTYTIIVNNIKDCLGNTLINLTLKIQWPIMASRNDIIVNEILFNPSTGENDFIELYNNSNKAVDLGKLFIATIDNNGQYKSIDKISNSNTILKAFSYLLLSNDTNSICQKYNCTNVNNIKINYNKMPSMPDDKGNIVLINLNGNVIDSLVYSERWHNPLISDNNGVSLERLSFNASTFSPYNWYSAASTAGFATPGYLNSQVIINKTSQTVFYLESKTVSPDEDGFEDLLLLNYTLGKPNFAATINIYNTQGILIKQLLNNETLATQGFVTWNGTDYNNQKANMGIYIITIECINPDGSIIKEKLSCVLAGRF